MRFIFYIVVVIIIANGLTGCINPARYLEKDQYLLYKKKIKGNKNISTENLETLQRQKPNRRVLGFPIYVWFYYWGQNTSDKKRIQNKIERVTAQFDKKIANAPDTVESNKLKKRKKARLTHLNQKLEKGSLFMRIVRPAAEAPEIYQEKLSMQTIDQMRLYMMSKGYFNSIASYKTDTSGKRIKVTYRVEEGEPHKLAEINYVIEDTAINNIVRSDMSSSLLKRGDNYEVDKINGERERIEALLRNNGYYAFNRQYIDFEYDSTVARYTSDSLNNILGKRRVDMTVLIHNPTEGRHKVYYVDSVHFLIDSKENELGLTRKKSYYKGITYHYFRPNYSKKVLNYKVFIRPGERYSWQTTIETQRQLINLDNFKFVSVIYDTTSNRFISRIFVSPASKYTTSEELGFSVSQRLPGPTANITFKSRNVFKGMENFESSIRYTFEGVATTGEQRKIYRTQELAGSTSLIFPQTLFPFNTGLKTRLNRFNPKTRLTGSYTYINRVEYTRTNLRANFIYSWQKGLNRYFSISPIDLSLANTLKTSEELDDSLASWKAIKYPLYYSFQDAIISNINASYTYSTYVPGVNREARYLNLYAESGGTVFNFLNSSVRKNSPDSIFGLPYFTYLRFTADFRYYHPLAAKSTMAYRANFGIARPYLTTTKALPYEKYFFAGGSTSIRAWKPRQLGPGAYNKDNNKFFEQPGEILLELSVEYRFNIIGKMDGAWFADAGNVWTYYKETYRDTLGVEKEVRPGGNFDWKRFYKEIAVGAGFGLRFNFSFLIIRLDAAYRVYDPAEDEGKRFVLNKIIDTPYNPPTFHIGINYPF